MGFIHSDCLVALVPLGGQPYVIDHLSVMSDTSVGEGAGLFVRMESCRGRVLYMDARKEGVAASHALLRPKPPSRIGKEDCIQLLSDKSAFTTDDKAARCRESLLLLLLL